MDTPTDTDDQSARDPHPYSPAHEMAGFVFVSGALSCPSTPRAKPLVAVRRRWTPRWTA